MAFITSNAFTKRKYGEQLRGHLAKNLAISKLIDFGEIKIFDATVEAYIVIGQKASPISSSFVRGHNLYPLLTRKIGRSGTTESAREEMLRLTDYLEAEECTFPPARLNSSEWRIEDEDVSRLFERIMNQGMSLGKFADDHIYWGVKTGLNEAFVIDKIRRDEIISEDSHSAELIKPWLRGRDIKRWRAERTGQYIIFARRGVDISHYPAIEEHLWQWRDELEPKKTSSQPGPGRKPGNYQWYEIQDSIAYYRHFAHQKVVWP